MDPESLIRVLRDAERAEGRFFRRSLDSEGVCRGFVVRWARNGVPRSVEIPLEPPTLEVTELEIDADGHACQLVRLGAETLPLYPVLDPVSLEHAVNVEQELLPAIVARYEQAAELPEFEEFHQRISRVRGAEEGAFEDLSEDDQRLLEIVKGDLSETTTDEEFRRRSFARFYQHRHCDHDRYRDKAHESLRALAERLSEVYGATVAAVEERLRLEGFDEEPPDAGSA